MERSERSQRSRSDGTLPQTSANPKRGRCFWRAPSIRRFQIHRVHKYLINNPLSGYTALDLVCGTSRLRSWSLIQYGLANPHQVIIPKRLFLEPIQDLINHRHSHLRDIDTREIDNRTSCPREYALKRPSWAGNQARLRRARFEIVLCGEGEYARFSFALNMSA